MQEANRTGSGDIGMFCLVVKGKESVFLNTLIGRRKMTSQTKKFPASAICLLMEFYGEFHKFVSGIKK
jgi:hypothetical protein